MKLPWRMARKELTIYPEGLNIYPGEYLTIWLNCVERDKERNATQLELRITEKGEAQIFSRVDRIHIYPFEEWKNDPENMQC